MPDEKEEGLTNRPRSTGHNATRLSLNGAHGKDGKEGIRELGKYSNAQMRRNGHKYDARHHRPTRNLPQRRKELQKSKRRG